jgi:hypothetical protein
VFVMSWNQPGAALETTSILGTRLAIAPRRAELRHFCLMGLYTVLGILFLFLVYREIERGPERSAPLHVAAAE